jgi:cytochrome b561
VVILYLAASMLAVVGVLLVFPFSGGTESFTFAVASPDGTLPALLFTGTQRTFGAVLVWIASLLVAAVIGHRIATSYRRSGSGWRRPDLRTGRM